MLGASRTYWDHDNWKDAIKSTASRTDGLVVLAGKTPSLSWSLTEMLGTARMRAAPTAEG